MRPNSPSLILLILSSLKQAGHVTPKIPEDLLASLLLAPEDLEECWED